jgi:hypothetical protein
MIRILEVRSWSWKANACDLLLETPEGPREETTTLPPFASPAALYTFGRWPNEWSLVAWDEPRALAAIQSALPALRAALGLPARASLDRVMEAGRARGLLEAGPLRGVFDGLSLSPDQRRQALESFAVFGRLQAPPSKPHRNVFPLLDAPADFSRSPDPELRRAAALQPAWMALRLATACQPSLPADYVVRGLGPVALRANGEGISFPELPKATKPLGPGAAEALGLPRLPNGQTLTTGPARAPAPGRPGTVWFAPTLAACSRRQHAPSWALHEARGVVYLQEPEPGAHLVAQVPLAEGGDRHFPPASLEAVGLYGPDGNAWTWSPALLRRALALVRPGGTVVTNCPGLVVSAAGQAGQSSSAAPM